MALISLSCADVPLSNYTHSPSPLPKSWTFTDTSCKGASSGRDGPTRRLVVSSIDSSAHLTQMSLI